ncbi:MAG TPA: serine hydrolase [Pyrinomonadaceae bacterium]|nr:serine hydrolase [Pyrinomonadaceae bacterium]
MKASLLWAAAAAVVLSSAAPAMRTASSQAAPAKELAGLWEAKRRFGPDVGGPLIVRQLKGEWRAEIAGRVAPARLEGDAISFELPDGEGAFRGEFDPRRAKITGHWVQPATVENDTPYASPVTLTKDGPDFWRGAVSPLGDALTFYLMVKPRDDGSVGAFLKNPERNIGRFIRVDRVEREGDSVKLFAADSAGERGRVLAEGEYHADGGTMSIYFPAAERTFDFRRVGANEASDFYPRGRPTAPYAYAPPPALGDGWQTASLEEVGISRAGVEKFIQMLVDTPIDSVGSQEVHGVLVARHGKLVLEEYFHGEHRDKPHDTRSAAKSLTSTLLGAAAHAGVPLGASSPVYRVMNGGAFPPDLEPRRRALTVEHLLTMSAGLDCDDGDPKSPGAEDNMQQQTEQPDYYKFALALKMIRDPGEKSVYCSAQSNLLGGVLQRASKRSLPALFRTLLAEPLKIERYYMNLTPTGDAYMGGGVRFLPRDFMKLGQLHLNGGTWDGRRVLTREWSQRATSHLVNIGARNRKYGYQWWVEDYPYKGRTVRAFFAGGNGGQVVIGIPELDLVIAFYGGNYNDPTLFVPQNVYVPQHILPAVEG